MCDSGEKYNIRLVDLGEERRGPLRTKVVQLRSLGGEEVEKRILALLEETDQQPGCVTAQGLAEEWGVAISLALLQLKEAEQRGSIVRDDSVEGLFFYKNSFFL